MGANRNESNLTLPDDSRMYLGNAEIVEALVRDFVSDIATATSAEEAKAAIEKKAIIFCGSDPAYETVSEWNDRLQLGMVICSRVGVDPNQDWMSIMRAGLGKLALEIRGTIQNHADQPIEEWSWQIDAMIEFWTSMLLGTLSLTHPEDSLED